MNQRNVTRSEKRFTRKKSLAWLLRSLLALAAAISPCAHAAEPGTAEPVRPSGPAWVRPKAPLSWTIDFRYPATAPKEFAIEGRLNKVAVSIVGQTTLESIRYAKASFDIWSTEGFVFIMDPETGRFDLRGNPPSVATSGVEPSKTRGGNSPGSEEPPPIPPHYQDWSGLKEFDWIKPELFQGTIKQGTEILHIYAELPEDMRAARQPAASPAPPAPGAGAGAARPAAPGRPAQKWPPGPLGGLPLRPGIKVVAVNAETRTPHFLQLGEIVREYVFSPVSTSNLELPKPITQALKTLGR